MQKYQKLPEPFRSDWIAALKSREYEQGNGSLNKDNTYCCLGVAAVICGHNKKEELEKYGILATDIHTNVPLELSNNSTLQWQLVQMNDNSHNTFEEIADWIEENL